MEKPSVRYELKEPIIALHNGHLYKAQDVSLKRNVLVYIVPLSGSYPAQEYIENLGRTGHIAYPSLLHVLDVEVASEHLSVILPYEQGEPLIRLIEQHTLALSDIVQLLVQLGQDLQDVLERRPLDFSLRAENLWLRTDHRLNVIQSWDKGTAKDRPSKELCRLFYQLVTRSAYVPEEMDLFREGLYRALASLPEERRTTLIKEAVLTMKEQTTLSGWIRSLQDAIAAPTGEAAADYVELTEEESEGEEPGRRSLKSVFGKKLWFGLGVSLVGIIVFIGMFALLFETVGKMLADDRKVAVAPATTPPPETAAPAEAAKPVDTKPAAPPANETQVQVPSLVGLSKEEAEKQALAAGLRYSYVLETSDQPAGRVVKQDPKPGDTAAKGTRVTFTVSKGAKP